jgi:transcription initiation factor IIE alpha subunit
MDYTLQQGTQVIDDVVAKFSINAQILRLYRVLKGYPEGVDRRVLCRQHKYKVKELQELMYELSAKGLAVIESKHEKGKDGKKRMKYTYRIVNDKDNDPAAKVMGGFVEKTVNRAG